MLGPALSGIYLNGSTDDENTYHLVHAVDDKLIKVHQQQRNTHRYQHTFRVRVVPYMKELVKEIACPSSVEVVKAQLGPLFPES